MNPAQLLDPKGFAKASKKKRTPNYGPQQSRKQPSAQSDVKVVIPTYDPKALLNPKAAAKPFKAMEPEGTPQETSDSLGNLYERHHNVKTREAPAAVKRKIIDAEDEDESDVKKQKTTFGPTSKGGIISEHLKKEREAHAKINDGPGPIDLTADNDDPEVVIVKATTKEICLGVLNVKAHCSMIPATGKSKLSTSGIWPLTKLTISRRKADNHIIELLDSEKKPFGRIEPGVANGLSNLMDGSGMSGFRAKAFLKPRRRKEGEVVGKHTSEILAITLVLYSPRDKADQIGLYLSQKQLWLNDPPATEGGREYYNPQNKKKIHAPTSTTNGVKQGQGQSVVIVQRTAEEKKRAVDKIFDSLVQHEDLEEMEPETDIIRTPLLKHQKQALQFMVDHEDDTNTTIRDSLWQVSGPASKEMWQNIITGQQFSSRPEPTQGGILADMMGLGKTLSIISLVATTKEQATEFLKTNLPQELMDVDGVASRATLIICPTSVLTNWSEQIVSHVSKGKLKVYVYHGSNRTKDIAELARNNIVMTSYGVVTAESRQNGKVKTLSKIKWFRIVLDEAHQIRNAGTEVFKAVCALHAQRRWAVTGTPVQNRLEDMGALVKFLQVKPFDEPGVWAQYITSPFRLGKVEAVEDLRLLVGSLTLRRQKDTIELPERTESVVRVQLSDDERRLYSSFAKQSNVKLQYMLRGQNKIPGSGYSHVLKAILRLRMICCHGPEMVSEADMKDIEGYDSVHAIDLGDEPAEGVQGFTSDREAYEMFEMQQDTGLDKCVECNLQVLSTDEGSEMVADDTSEDGKQGVFGFLTPCFHLLHVDCQPIFRDAAMNKVGVDNYYECNHDQAWVRHEYFQLTHEGLQSFREERNRKSSMRKQANYNPESYTASTKVKKLIEELQQSAQESDELPEGEPPIRSVVFSEWTTFLDLIGIGLEYAGINYVRLDGSMSVKERAKVLNDFKTDPDVSVMIVSIKAGGQGLNYTAANKVYLMEPQFNPGVEQQAVDRVHRLGQTRDVEITHFITTDSIEEKILELQEKKIKLAKLSLERKRATLEDAQQRLAEVLDLVK